MEWIKVSIILPASICAMLSLVSSMKCPSGLKPFMTFAAHPSNQITVGSDIVLICNATTLGIDSKFHSPDNLDKIGIEIHAKKKKKACKFEKTGQQTAHCTLSIKNVDYSDKAMYTCIVKIEGGGLGCLFKHLYVDVKDCTRNKTDLLATEASLTLNNTILVKWRYVVESCDKGFIIYWSSNGPVTNDSNSVKLSNVVNTSYEIIGLEPHRKYWFGVAVNTSKGVSEIFRGKVFLQTKCSRNRCHENATCKRINDSAVTCVCKPGYTGDGSTCSLFIATDPGPSVPSTVALREPSNDRQKGDEISMVLVIFFTLFVCSLFVLGIIGYIIFKRRRKSNSEAVVPAARSTSNAAHNIGILFPDPHDNSPKEVALDDCFDFPKMVAINECFDEEEESQYLAVLDEWELPRNRLIITAKRLGVGQFGIVKKGIYRAIIDGEEVDQTVAVKVLKDNASEIDRQDLLTELRILKFVNLQPHPNVLKLIGACTHEAPVMVIAEYCSKGNLKDVLDHIRPRLTGGTSTNSEYVSKVTPHQLLKIAVDITEGMKHLVSMKFVHRDLAARNILIGDEWVAKISDFGLARETQETGEYIKSRRNLLPVKWTAIEALVEGKFTTASDVWSYGVLLWEISSIGEEPYKSIDPHNIMSHVGSGGRLAKPDACSPYLYEIMQDCWDALPEKRPSFDRIYEKLSVMLREPEKLYINVEFMDEVQKNKNDFERYTSP